MSQSVKQLYEKRALPLPNGQEGQHVSKKRDKKLCRKLVRIGDADGSNFRETMEVFCRGFLTKASTEDAHFENAVHVRLGSAEAALWINEARVLAGSLLEAIDRCEEATNDRLMKTLKDDGYKPLSGWIDDERAVAFARNTWRKQLERCYRNRDPDVGNSSDAVPRLPVWAQ